MLHINGLLYPKFFCPVLSKESFAICFYEIDSRKAVGMDGVDKARYGERLDENLEDMVKRMKHMAYRPEPVRQVNIPKEGKLGATRPLGISTVK